MLGSSSRRDCSLSNVTVERWAALLQARPSGMFMFRDELAGHFLNMSRYTNGQDNEFWLEAFNGKHYVVERQSAPAINIPHLLIGICGGLQPDKLARSFEGDDDGMYTRICFAWPSAAAYRPLSDDVAELEPELVNAFSRLASLPCIDADGNLVSRSVWLSDEARAEFEQFRQFLHLDLTNSMAASANGGRRGRRMSCGSPARLPISAGRGSAGLSRSGSRHCMSATRSGCGRIITGRMHALH